MVRVFACIVIGFFTVLWATGNTPASVKDEMVHWADGNAKDATGAGAYSGDWGS